MSLEPSKALRALLARGLLCLGACSPQTPGFYLFYKRACGPQRIRPAVAGLRPSADIRHAVAGLRPSVTSSRVTPLMGSARPQ